MKKVVVVAPTFNEEENIAGFLAAVKNYDVVISDSHSSDKTPEIVKKLSRRNKKIHYLDVKKRGLGLGLSKGLDYAIEKLGADILITMEADLSCDPKLIPQFLSKMNQADLVLGSRYIPGGQVNNWSWWRRLLSRGANLTLSFIVGSSVHEYTNLYRAFTKDVWIKLRSQLNLSWGWLFVPAFVFEALHYQHWRIMEQPIVYCDRFGGRSKMKTLSYTKNLIEYALRYRRRKYGQNS